MDVVLNTTDEFNGHTGEVVQTGKDGLAVKLDEAVDGVDIIYCLFDEVEKK